MKMIVEDLTMMIIIVVIIIHLGVIMILAAPGNTIIMRPQIEIIIIDNVIVIQMNIIANDDHLMIIHKLKLNHGRNYFNKIKRIYLIFLSTILRRTVPAPAEDDSNKVRKC
jgi:hypothetical protein